MMPTVEQFDAFLAEFCQPGKTIASEFCDSVLTYYGLPNGTDSKRAGVLWLLQQRGHHSTLPAGDPAHVFLSFKKAPCGIHPLTGKPL